MPRLFVASGFYDFFATIETVGTDMMSAMRFSGRLVHG